MRVLLLYWLSVVCVFCSCIGCLLYACFALVLAVCCMRVLLLYWLSVVCVFCSCIGCLLYACFALVLAVCCMCVLLLYWLSVGRFRCATAAPMAMVLRSCAFRIPISISLKNDFKTMTTMTPKSEQQIQAIPTALFDQHERLGGRMVPFAGALLPVSYENDGGAVHAHRHARTHAALFDVSHMGQVRLEGKNVQKFMEKLVAVDIQKNMKNGQAKLAILTNERGGAIDDCIITKIDENVLHVVVNAGCKEKDKTHIEEQIKMFKQHEHGQPIHIHNWSEAHELLALQGPEAVKVLGKCMTSESERKEMENMPFMFSREAEVAGVKCMITRAGYTGEDGFEMSVPTEKVKKVFNALLEHKEVNAAGLAVRDSLRLEAGLCLYGHDLNEDITPVEAGLLFTIQKRRRLEGGFLGAEVILKQLAEGVQKKRVGMIVAKGAPPAREGTELRTIDGEKVGVVTSGGYSPILNVGISMGYVNTAHSADGTKLHAIVRNKPYEVTLTKMPFVPTRYYKPAATKAQT